MQIVNLLLDEEVSDSEKEVKLKEVMSGGDMAVLNEVGHHVGMNMARKDIGWKKALNSSLREAAITAFKEECKSLTGTGVLKEVSPGDAEYSIAVEKATAGRVLLDQKRNGTSIMYTYSTG